MRFVADEFLKTGRLNSLIASQLSMDSQTN